MADLGATSRIGRANEGASGQAVSTWEEAIRANPSVGNDTETIELKRRHEQARLRKLVACRAREEVEKLRKARVNEEIMREGEAKAQKKLRDMVCAIWAFAGSNRIWVTGARGAHFISNAQLGF